jgi:hypothetical protein
MLRVRQSDDWMTRLAKLIPAEALAFYGTISGMIPTDDVARKTYLFGLAALTMVLTIVLRARATKAGFATPQWAAVAIAAASFLFWVAALPAEASPLSIDPSKQWMPGVAAFIWATLVTMFYSGDP